jgi:hypothetical protein
MMYRNGLLVKPKYCPAFEDPPKKKKKMKEK